MAKVSPLVAAPPLVFIALAALFFFGMQREDPDALPSTRVGSPAPDMQITPLGTLPGFDAADFATGEVILVNFWASWCGPCRVEHPTLEALADEGQVIYGINYKDDPAKGLGFLAELGNPYKGVMADSSGRTGIEWGLYGVPETFVIDGDGIVRLRFAGPVTEEILETRIRPAIEAATSP